MRIPASRILCCGCNRQIRTGYRNPLEEKGQHGHSLRERARESPRESPTPAWTGFYFFSGHITSGMVLVYYAQAHCRWLPFTDNKGQNAANYFKEKDVTAQGGKWLNWLHSILGWFSTGFRKLKILSKNLLPQSRVREFSKSNCHSSLGAMQTWFPMGEPVHGLGSCMLNITPTGFSEWELGYISDTWNSSLYNIMLL